MEGKTDTKFLQKDQKTLYRHKTNEFNACGDFFNLKREKLIDAVFLIAPDAEIMKIEEFEPLYERFFE